jgi:pimeloyl-ACP methyl ester carboxylesterase
VGVGRWGWEPVAARLARRDVLAVLDHAGIPRASLVGTSLGGMIAQELALAHPERVDKLVLVATIPGGPAAAPCR